MKTELLFVGEAGNRADALRRATEILAVGGLVAFPTDTVYGVGARAFSTPAVERLYAAKGRSLGKAIPVLLASVAQLAQVVIEPSPAALRLAERFWPGPLTMVLKRNPGLPEAVSSTSTVGVRIPDHPVALALLAAVGPLAVSSANRAGGRSPQTATQVLDALNGRIDLLLDGGRTAGGQPSTVIDCTGEEVTLLRAGPISIERVQAVAKGAAG